MDLDELMAVLIVALYKISALPEPIGDVQGGATARQAIKIAKEGIRKAREGCEK